jgi:catechol 2,3-dioxygenase-like lactoylglutathione lyase family enzyme
MERPARLHHVALRCSELERCERFYSEVLGLEVLKRWPGDGGRDRSVWLALGDGQGFLALERADVPRAQGPFEAAPAGWYVVALSVPREARTRWEEHLAAHGIEVVRESPWSLFFADPEGNRVALTHWPEES